ncbi:MAG: deoxyribose-phosphate aldolase [Christensenella sp.]|nr:deoxyribose-phosphate aldolase [Christensenella sp.]
MEAKEILSHVDHTLLSASATWDQIQTLCDEAIEYQTASVCIPQAYISRVKEKYGDQINICTVIGFPLGYNSTGSKIVEAKDALVDGASEVDMVINITDAKNKDFKKIEDEIARIKETVGNKILKVIIETCYLSEDEKIEVCNAVTNAGADYIKTSTGFGTGGATQEDIRLFRQNIGSNVKMKAAGGIRTVEDMEMFLNEGCDRLGTSSAIKLIKGQESKGY